MTVPRTTRPFAIKLYAIDTQRPVLSQSYYVQSASSDDVNDVSVTTAIRSGAASSKTKVATDVENDDQNTLRAQIDSGAFTSCTNQHLVTSPVIASAAAVATSDPELAAICQGVTTPAIYARRRFATDSCQRLPLDFSVSGATKVSDYLTKPLRWALDAESPLDFQTGRR